MQYNVNKYVRASDISAYMICPRMAYYRVRSDVIENHSMVRSELFRSLSARLYEIVISDSPQTAFDQLVNSVCLEELIIRGDGPSGHIAAVRKEIESKKEAIITGLKIEESRYGRESLLRSIVPRTAREHIVSEKLKLSAVIDKVAAYDEKIFPVVVAPSPPPENGAYRSDRIKLALFCMLLCDKYGADAREGYVEYSSGWALRKVSIKPVDMRQVLSAASRSRKMYDGRLPENNRGEWCKQCGHISDCNVRVSFLDSLLKRNG